MPLEENPGLKARLDDERFLTHLVQEVRRFYPFFPIVTGRVRKPFEEMGHRFERDDLVMFDLYGTDHHPAVWKNPDRFDPDRFLTEAITPWTLVPQGAGDHATGHRCPGEFITLALIWETLKTLATRLDYRVPKQDLSFRMNRMRTRPKSGFLMENI